MIDPHKTKYHALYWTMAEAAAAQSESRKLKVGAVVVTASGMISPGWNGMPAGFDNACETLAQEYYDLIDVLKTRPEVVHAERNALDKLHRQGVATAGSVVFTTLSPCWECAKSLIGLGLKAVYYDAIHDQGEGLVLLEKAGVPIYQRTPAPLRGVGES